MIWEKSVDDNSQEKGMWGNKGMIRSSAPVEQKEK